MKVLGQTHERAAGRIWTLLATESDMTTDFSLLGSELLSRKNTYMPQIWSFQPWCGFPSIVTRLTKLLQPPLA